ncbi:unnamed protein product [Oikopleura dioica]|uniref:Uncharacterized protein n=1 Tax=Oikopleura dioica TaxID=34765 RepID=E4YEQ1_OIKDI|nr:unnamed protein product [Oikopleura dioica]
MTRSLALEFSDTTARPGRRREWTTRRSTTTKLPQLWNFLQTRKKLIQRVSR